MSQRLAHGALVVVTLALLGWSIAAVTGVFAREASFSDVEGAWEIDEAAHAQLLAGQPGAEALRGTAYRFQPGSYVRVTSAGEQEVPCTYERTAADALTVRPRAEAPAGTRAMPVALAGSGGPPEAWQPFQVVLDPGRTRLAIRTATIPLPFRRPEPNP